MAVDGIGFALGVIPELRHQVFSMQKRISNFVEGPATFRGLTTKLDGMTADFQEVESIIRTQPSVVPEVSSAMIRRRLETVQNCLQESGHALDELSKHAFPGSSSGKRKKMKLMFPRFFRADSISEKMTYVAGQVGEAASELRGLVSTLTMCIKVENLSMNLGAGSAEPNYKPDGSTPALAPTVSLDYSSKDACGSFVTPEGELKHFVLSSASSASVTAAAGVVGMAGVGKTIALQGLAHEEEIRARFPDGIHYISLGHSATLQNVINEVGKVMRITGAAGIVDKVKSSASLREAVDYAVMWFRDKVCLFLIDDLWPTKSCKSGYLNDLRQLLRGSPESRMAITTRSHDIALAAGSIVDFAARDPLGPVSERLFMAFATGNCPGVLPADTGDKERSSVSKILGICGGLPIALSVAGCAVAFILKAHEDFESACDTYVTELESTKMSIGDKEGPGGKSLKAGILLSLKYLDAEFQEWKAEYFPDMQHTVTSLYTSLCVLQNQAWISVSVLCRLWNIDKYCALHVLNRICKMSLATLHYRKAHGPASEAGLVLHDLHLDFCRRQAQVAHMESLCHEQLLNGYRKKRPNATATSAARTILCENEVLNFSPRAWWSDNIPEDAYIHANLARHLARSNQLLELAALLLDARWIHLGLRIRGILALRGDFSSFCGSISHQIKQSFDFILKALQLSWGTTVHGQRALLFQICGRLRRLSREDTVVSTFLKSFEKHTPRPYLLPVNQFPGGLHSAQLMEIPTKMPCMTVACSPCERYLAIGGYTFVFVAGAAAGDVLKTLEGHAGPVTTISFAAGSGIIVSGSSDRKIMVWEWEKYDRSVRVLEGHTDGVTSLAISSDGQEIFSGSEDCTLRHWDRNTGAQIANYLQLSSISSVCVCTENRLVVLGLFHGDVVALEIRTGSVVFNGLYVHASVFCEDIPRNVGVHLCTALSPDSKLLATASSDEMIQLWDTNTWERVGNLSKGNQSTVNSVCFAPDGKKIASGSQDGKIRVYDIASREIVSVSPDVGCPIECATFTYSGEQIVCALNSGSVQVWDAVLTKEKVEEEIRHSEAVSSVAISRDALQIASLSFDGAIQMFNFESFRQIVTFASGRYSGVGFFAFSPNGQIWAYPSGTELCVADKHELISVRHLKGHTENVTCASFSVDGSRIISGSKDKTVRIWSALSPWQIGYELKGHESEVCEVSETTDARYIVSREIDKKVFIWKRESGMIVWTSKQNAISEIQSITNEEAEVIIRNCGSQAQYLWPEWLTSFPRYLSDVSCIGDVMFSKTNSVLGTWAGISAWKYDDSSKTFAAGLENGGIVICKFVS